VAAGVLSLAAVEELRNSHTNTASRDGARSDARALGSIFSFVPAHGGCRAGAVAQQLSRTLTEGLAASVLLADFDRRAYSVWSPNEAPRRLDGRTWGAFVSHVDGISVLNAREVHPQRLPGLLDYARKHFSIVCADLTGAREEHASAVLRASDAIFLVSGSDGASIEGAREKMEWLQSIDLADRCGILLEHTPHGTSAAEVEDLTGIAVSGLVENGAQIRAVARWLAANSPAAINAVDDSEYAVA
jgi:Flp pilus assembly CpaE family ATPase